MARRSTQFDLAPLPPLSKWLGFAGLIPQIALAAAAATGPRDLTIAAMSLALCYSALILSFIGGAWWGLAAQPAKRARSWMWLVAVTPSLVAFGALGALVLDCTAVPGLAVIGAALISALAIDYKLAKSGWCPSGWLRLRMPLSLGLGSLTLLIASLGP